MAGALRKTMIYLGLAEGDEQSAQDSYQAPAPRDDHRHEDAEPAQPRSEVTGRADSPARSESSRARLEERSFGTERSSGQPARNAGGAVAAELPEDTATDFRAPVTPIKRAAAAVEEETQLRQITTVHPRSYNDAKTIGESFRDGIPVIMNVTDMGEAEAKRLVDFSAGLVFALRGNIERVTNKVFLLTPAGVEILGEDLAGEEHTAFFNQS